MATQAPTTGTLARTMILNAEAAKIASIMARFDRRKLETFLEAGVELLDAIEGDHDLEPNGDELDGAIGEDDPLFHDEHPLAGNGPGCDIADPDAEHDGREHEYGM